MLHKDGLKEEATKKQGACASDSGAPISTDDSSGPGVAPTGRLAGLTSEEPVGLADACRSGAEKTSAVVISFDVAQTTKEGGRKKTVKSKILGKALSSDASIVKKDATGPNLMNSAISGKVKKSGRNKSMALTGVFKSAPSQPPGDAVGPGTEHPAPSRMFKTKAEHSRSVANPALSRSRLSKKPTQEPEALANSGNPSFRIAVPGTSDKETPGSVTVRPPEKTTVEPPVLARSGSRSQLNRGEDSADMAKKIASAVVLPESVVLSDEVSPFQAGSQEAEINALLHPGTDSVVVLIPHKANTEGSNSVQQQALALSSTSATSPSGKRSKGRPQAVASTKLAMSLQETAEALMGMSDQRRQQASTGVEKRGTIFMLMSLATVLVGALVWYLMPVRRPHEAVVNESFCTSLGCVQHADLIGLSESSNAPHEGSPCDHFGRFVCSAWEARHKRRNERRRFTRSVKTDAIMDRIVSLETFGSRTVLPISKRPALMIELCLTNRSSDDTQSLEQLLNFMLDTGYGFPEDNADESNYSRPLRATVELADKWAHPLWFRVNIVLPENNAKERIILLSNSPVVEVWNDFQGALMVYQNIYLLYVDVLISTIYKGSMESSFHKFVTQSKLMQKHIFGNLSKIVANKFHNPVWMKINNLPLVVRNTSAEDWLYALQPLWGIDPPISEDDTVYVEDRDLLVVMNRLFAAYTARDIYLHIHWWFVQSIGAITSNSLFDYLLMDPERGHLFRKIICSIHVLLNYNTILTSEKRASLSDSEHATLMAALSHIHNVTVSKVSSIMGAKLALLEKLKPVFWPPDPYNDEKHLLRLYGDQMNSIASNIIEIWLSSVRGYQQSRAFLHERSTHAAIFGVDSSSVSAHNIVSRTVSLSLALLNAPYYYPNVTSAIIYGGIGFAYASELVRTLNSISLLLDGKDVIEPSEDVISQSYIWNIWIPFVCRGLTEKEIFPGRAALEVAYSTYLKFRRNDEDFPLENAKRYTPEQIFFATVCYLMCDLAKGADECNSSMQRFPPFLDAFSCPVQKNVCTFLS